MTELIEKNTSGSQKLTIDENGLTWEWNQGIDSGRSFFKFDSLSPALGYNRGRPSDFEPYVKKALFFLILALIGFNSPWVSENFPLANFVFCAALLWYLWQAKRYWYVDEWFTIFSASGDYIVAFSYKHTDEGARKEFEREFARLVEVSSTTNESAN